jgi:hypothetical protein
MKLTLEQPTHSLILERRVSTGRIDPAPMTAMM